MRPGWRVIAAEWIPAAVEVADRLAIEVGTEVYQLRRLRLADNEPIGYHIAHVVRDLGVGIDESHLEEGGSLSYLRESGQLNESYANRTIEAILASEKVAKVLEISKGSPLLMIRRRVFNAEGTPVEDMRAMYRGDRFQYRVRQWPRQ
jgi:GntR family transcriptional regulator